MMSGRLSKLVSIAGPILGSVIETSPDLGQGRLGEELAALLTKVNGFYAFESALHVFPAGRAEHTMGLRRWNDDHLWRSGYEDLAEGYLFFAEDVFGCQFAIKNETVFSFDPETGESVAIAETLEGWAAALLEDYEVNTGYPLAHDWQLRNGVLLDGLRLVPKRPFVLGGEFSVENLYALDSVKGMRLRAELAVQLRDLPEGATVNFTVVE
jgi:hypothetical protein